VAGRPRGNSAELSGSYGWEGTGPHPHDQVSPISKIRTLVLIVQGEDDTNVPLGQVRGAQSPA
jgi:hypothetical protein